MGILNIRSNRPRPTIYLLYLEYVTAVLNVAGTTSLLSAHLRLTTIMNYLNRNVGVVWARVKTPYDGG